MAQIEQADIERVMEVAGQLFAENGYEGVGIRQIAAESGIKVASILYHFGSKATLYEEILDYKYRAITEMIAKTIAPLNGPMEKLECIIGTIFDLFMRNRTFLLLVQREITDTVAQKHRPGFAREYADIIALTSTLLQAAFNRPVEHREAFSLVSLILGYSELTAAMGEHGPSGKGMDWYAAQRDELLAVGKRIFS